MSDLIKLRRDSATNWSSNNPVLSAGELGVDTTNDTAKVGDGSTPWNSLPVFISPASAQAIYGDGGDGDVTISGTVSLTRDMNYRNLVIPSGASIQANGCRIFVSQTLTGSGNINNNGSNGGAAAGFAPLSNVYHGTGTSGGAPTTTAGGAGTAIGAARALGGVGGDGGLGSSGAGGVGGTTISVTGGGVGVTTATATLGLNPFTVLIARTLVDNVSPRSFAGGTGGGAGGSDGTAHTNGGGGGGGVNTVFARDTSGYTGSIRAIGGNGGSSTAGNRGGGGGGGGGFVCLVTSSTFSGTVDASGGTGGAKSGTGVAGNNGSDGVALVMFV